jgi:hypothetical protein
VPENAEGEAQWTAKEQLAHLASMETSYRAWVEKALEEDGADLAGVVPERPAISLRTRTITGSMSCWPSWSRSGTRRWRLCGR